MEDKIKSTKNFGENIFTQKYGFSEINPFSSGYNPDATNPIVKPQKRLNGYDSTMLNNTTETSGEDLSFEYRVKEKEAQINDLNDKIKIADNYGTQNEALVLKAKRHRVQQELDTLKKQQLLSGRVLGESNFTHNSFKAKMPIIYKIQEFISRQLLAKVSKKVNSVVALSDSLEQLSEISKSVDELIEMNVPYGEKVQNYEKLTQYLNQANTIHSKITKSLGKK